MGRMKQIMLMIEDGMSFEDIAKHMNKSPRFEYEHYTAEFVRLLHRGSTDTDDEFLFPNTKPGEEE